MKKLKEKLNAKLSKNGGFTLVEMLIVVAIIAILIAISIPLFSSTLERARHGVDQANMRNAISMGTLEYMGSMNPKTEFQNAVNYAYVVRTDAGYEHQASLEKNGNSTTAGVVKPQCSTADDNGLVVTVQYDTTTGGPKVTLNWAVAADNHITTTEVN